MKKFKRGGNRFSFIGVKGTDECDYNNYLPFTTAIKKASFMFALSSLFIKFIAFVIKTVTKLLLVTRRYDGFYFQPCSCILRHFMTKSIS